MTAKNRSKNSSNSNSSGVASPQPDHDAAKKTPGKVAVKAENAPLASRGSGSDALMMMIKCVCALFSLALAAGVVLASVHFQRELSEIKHASVRYEESAMKCAAAAREVENALTQVSGLHPFARPSKQKHALKPIGLLLSYKKVIFDVLIMFNYFLVTRTLKELTVHRVIC